MKKKNLNYFLISVWIIILLFTIFSLLKKENYAETLCTNVVSELEGTKQKYSKELANKIFSNIEPIANNEKTIQYNNRYCFVNNDIGFSVDIKIDESGQDVLYGKLIVENGVSKKNLSQELKSIFELEDKDIELLVNSTVDKVIVINDDIKFIKREIEKGNFYLMFTLTNEFRE